MTITGKASGAAADTEVGRAEQGRGLAEVVSLAVGVAQAAARPCSTQPGAMGPGAVGRSRRVGRRALAAGAREVEEQVHLLLAEANPRRAQRGKLAFGDKKDMFTAARFLAPLPAAPEAPPTPRLCN